MSQDWNFGPQTPAHAPPAGPRPTPERFRTLLRREAETLDSIRASTAAPEGEPPPEGRDAQGRFAPGNRLGTGNPFARQTAAFRKALVNAVTEEDITELAGVLLAKAKDGDLAAIKLLFAYVLGKPAEAPDPDRLELDDWQLLKERLCPLREDWDLIRKMVPVEGLVQAGHKVADLRAQCWREEVHPAGAPAAEPARCDTAEKVPEDLDAAEVSALVDEMVALIRAERAALPSANGSDGRHAPSANGGNGAGPPSANGSDGRGGGSEGLALPAAPVEARESAVGKRS